MPARSPWARPAYALSLGLANGDLFGSIIAFSPGYIVRATGRGKPLLFIAHGGADPVLPAATSSRIFVASLRKNGYTPSISGSSAADTTFRPPWPSRPWRG